MILYLDKEKSKSNIKVEGLLFYVCLVTTAAMAPVEHRCRPCPFEVKAHPGLGPAAVGSPQPAGKPAPDGQNTDGAARTVRLQYGTMVPAGGLPDTSGHVASCWLAAAAAAAGD